MSEVLIKYFNPNSIELAFRRVQCWTDKTVKDQVGLRAFGTNLEFNSKKLSEKIISGNYKPQRGFKFYVPKASFTNRTKTLLFAEDAIVYQAIADTIALESYDTLQQQESFVFGSVLSPEVKKGVAILGEEDPNYFFFKFWKNLFNGFKESIIHSIEVDKAQYKFETDITGFFDCIPHYNLLAKLSERFKVEDEILDLLSSCLNIWSGTKESVTPGVGVPQGPLPSFLLANLILHDLDELIISEGFKYYRYMDDIKIYGYEERELVKALVLIDKYLKGNGLSINSKKTTIEKIEEGVEDATVKELKKVETFSFYDAIDDDIQTFNIEALLGKLTSDDSAKKDKSESEKEINKTSKLSDQEQNSDFFDTSNVNILTDEKEIIQYWETLIAEVETNLPKLFKEESNDKLVLNEDVDDIDFIKLSAQYGISVRKLSDLKSDFKPNDKLLKYWLFAYKKFFWRANNFGLTLGLYRYNDQVKSELLNLVLTDFVLYEWARYFALQTLSLSQNFTDKDLRQEFFKMLQEEQSDLVKISLYRLLFGHSNGEQFNATLRKQLQKENNQYLKILIADFNKNHSGKDIDIVEFLNSIGL
jgi:retron-type reverse transcriptase